MVLFCILYGTGLSNDAYLYLTCIVKIILYLFCNVLCEPICRKVINFFRSYENTQITTRLYCVRFFNAIKIICKKKEYFKFYMHGIGHWLGLDTHDECPYVENGKPMRLEPGMVLTVEPGIYIREDLKRVPKRWMGIGVRIEDDVLVTRRGPKVLTDAIPRDPDEIESLMADGVE